MRIKSFVPFDYGLFINPGDLRAMAGHIVPVKNESGEKVGEATVVKAEQAEDRKGLMLTLDLSDELWSIFQSTSGMHNTLID